ncbi:MAG: YceI family protein [Chitinophagales bacterium]|nr:YceI family protein [Chitinophagales bacterium]MBP8752972.1 YceI family protein [Chitinophagales bacterium]MBP9188590.1 YceI family protein [Chitinophagales bacterium]MBP9549236.1 YceI family protein [Chitinophagales bacterium]MBP9704778.1 YceI family protein [Chitinophagales bacterium]
MKSIKIIGCFLFLLMTGTLVQAQSKTYKLVSGSTMKISGGSNAHDWSEEVKTMSGSASIDTDRKTKFTLAQLTFKADVKSIKSTKGSVMDDKTHEALNADKYPYITFDLVEVKSVSVVAGGFWITTQGNLSMNGVKKLIDLDVKAIMNSNGTISFEGNKSFNMSLYGIDPPTAMMGTMKVKDPVRIDFKVTYQ